MTYGCSDHGFCPSGTAVSRMIAMSPLSGRDLLRCQGRHFPLTDNFARSGWWAANLAAAHVASCLLRESHAQWTRRQSWRERDGTSRTAMPALLGRWRSCTGCAHSAIRHPRMNGFWPQWHTPFRPCESVSPSSKLNSTERQSPFATRARALHKRALIDRFGQNCPSVGRSCVPKRPGRIAGCRARCHLETKVPVRTGPLTTIGRIIPRPNRGLIISR
jgi:hypothetical protein